jgi:hypothetical protein
MKVASVVLHTICVLLETCFRCFVLPDFRKALEQSVPGSGATIGKIQDLTFCASFE